MFPLGGCNAGNNQEHKSHTLDGNTGEGRVTQPINRLAKESALISKRQLKAILEIFDRASKNFQRCFTLGSKKSQGIVSEGVGDPIHKAERSCFLLLLGKEKLGGEEKRRRKTPKGMLCALGGTDAALKLLFESLFEEELGNGFRIKQLSTFMTFYLKTTRLFSDLCCYYQRIVFKKISLPWYDIPAQLKKILLGIAGNSRLHCKAIII